MSSLTYPFQAPACNGELVDVVPGCIKGLRMPLPMALNHINLYLVRDDTGWRLIDTGFDNAVTRGLWEQILPRLGASITGIVCTHHHVDHSGLAGWLTPLFVCIVAYVFLGLAEVSEELSQPFGENVNALPLDAICRAAEISLAPHLGRKPPPPLLPKDFQLQ